MEIIYIGVATSDFDINKSTYSNCGWCLYIWNNTLISGLLIISELFIQIGRKQNMTK